MTALAIASTISPTLIAITPRAALLVGGNVSCARIPIAETTTAQTASTLPQT